LTRRLTSCVPKARKNYFTIYPRFVTKERMAGRNFRKPFSTFRRTFKAFSMFLRIFLVPPWLFLPQRHGVHEGTQRRTT